MDRVLPPVTSFVDSVQSPSYRGLLEGHMEGRMEADVNEVEGRMRELDTRARTGYENSNYAWTTNNNHRFHQNYLSSCRYFTLP